MADEVIKIRTELEDNASNALKGIRSSLKAAFGVASVAMIANFTMKMVKLASAAEEINSKFNVVFRGVKGVNEQIDLLAKKTGFARSTLEKMTSELGDFLIPMGFARKEAFKLSESITKLSLDLASFNNVTNEEVLEAFKSAMSGMSRPLLRFGIDVRETALAQEAFNMKLIDSVKAYDKLDSETKRAVRAQALMSKAMKDSADAIGDLERTSNSYANVQRRANEQLKEAGENIGRLLMPIVGSLASEVGKLAKGFSSLLEIPIVKKIQEEQFEFNVLINSLNTVNVSQETRNKLISILQSKYKKYIGNINLETASNEDLAKMQERVNSAFLQKIKLQLSQEKITELQKKANELQDQASEKLLEYNRLVLLKQEATKKDSVLTSQYSDVVDKAMVSQSGLLEAWDIKVNVAKRQWKELQDAATEANKQIKIEIDKAAEGGLLPLENEGITPEKTVTIEKANDAINKHNELTKEMKKWEKELNKELEIKDEALKKEFEYFNKLFEIEDQLNEDRKRWKKEQDDIDEKRKNIQENMINYNAELIGSFADLFNVFGQKSKEAFDVYKGFAIAETIISTYAAAQKQFEALSLFPPAAYASAAAAIISGLARVAMISQQQYQGKEYGGQVQAGVPYTVGERGREVFISNLDGYIIPNRLINKMGGNKVININAVMDAEAFKMLLRNGGNRVLQNEISTGRL